MNQNKFWENVKAYSFIMPFLLVFIIFLGYPIVYSIWLSAHEAVPYSDWYNIMNEMDYVGAKHYKSLLQDKDFLWSLLLTFYYGILTIPTTIALSLFLAILLQRSFRGRTFFRSAFFLPNVLDLFVVGIIWILLYSPDYGLLNMLAKAINSWTMDYFNSQVFPNKIEVLSSAVLCLPAIAFAMVLKGAGFGMILFLTAINNIPQSVYEAAEIDGTSELKKLWYITLPLVRPIMLFMTITGTIACLTAFTEIYAMTVNTGGPTVQVFGDGDKLNIKQDILGNLPIGKDITIEYTLSEKEKPAKSSLLNTMINFRPPKENELYEPMLEIETQKSLVYTTIIKHRGNQTANNPFDSHVDAFDLSFKVDIPKEMQITKVAIIADLGNKIVLAKDQYSITNNSETLKAANLSGYYLYRNFIDGYYGKAAAISFVLLGIALVISLINVKVLQKQD